VKRHTKRIHKELRAAQHLWGKLDKPARVSLTHLVAVLGISVFQGDVQFLDGRWYVTHAGLLRIAHRQGCFSLITNLDRYSSDPTVGRWVFKATVFRSAKSRPFIGYGDADHLNVSPLVRGSELRIAETRAVNRALRKAYGIGICSVEELGATCSKPASDPYKWTRASANHSNNGQPRLRDQLSVLIRQHNLDPALVKAYAADFCGTATLSGASRELIESFISHLSSTAKENRDSLVCKLNSYATSPEVRP
jgi:hypothetical protein